MAVIDLNKEQFVQLTNGEQPVLVDYWAPWCGYCRRIAPAFERVSEKYTDSIIFAKLDIDSEPALSDAEKIEIIPTLVMYKNGKVIDSIVNPPSQAAIESFIQNALEK